MMPISNVGYYLTNRCNFRCEYCFENDEDFRGDSDFKTGKATIDWLLSPEISGEAKQVSISFFGGEPMLKMGLLKQLVEYGESLNQKNQKKIKFGITSNGSLLTKELIDWFVKHEVNILYSIDGDEETQNKHRKLVNGKGSWSLIYPTLKYFVEKQPQNVARLTICPDTASKMFSNVKYLIEEIGFKSTAPTPVGDSYLEWTNESMAIMSKEYEKIERWIAERIRKKVNNPICIGYLQKSIRATLSNKPLMAPCGAGRGYVGVSCDGGVYPCHRFTNWDEYKLGVVFERKLDEEKRKQFSDFDKSNNLTCKDCAIKFCGGQCYASNIVVGKKIDTFNPQICKLNAYLQRTAINLIKEFRGDSYFLNMFKSRQKPRGSSTDTRRLYEGHMILMKRVNKLEEEMRVVKQALRKARLINTRLVEDCKNCSTDVRNLKSCCG